MIPAQADKSALNGNTTHGLTTLKKAVKVLGGRLVDRRTTLGKLLDEWRAQLVLDLGGVEQVSTQQLAIVNLAVKTKLLLDSVDTWLLKQPSLINHRKRMLYPVVLQRQQLADALARYMGQLGLERREQSTAVTATGSPVLLPELCDLRTIKIRLPRARVWLPLTSNADQEGLGGWHKMVVNRQ